ncbi:MAG: T9SS C-terminal target domain-containing protein, partial [Ignavibacteria bacterium]
AGISWFDLSKGLPSGVIIKSLQITESNNTMKAATHGNGVYEIHLPDIALSAEKEPSLPTGFKLYQNFPNPFNPTTQITYSISKFNKPQFVKLTIYDLIGQTIATLVSEKQPPGNYKVTFEASSEMSRLTSGIYLYTLRVGNFSQTKKMILLK